MKRETPLFTIVIANYNGAEYLQSAISSVLNQSCRDFELIDIDGGSTDNSVDIIKNYESHLAWWVSEKDYGQSDAFNKGFSRAKGQYYLWVNSDDLLLPRSLECAKKTIRDNPECKWFAANTVFFGKDGKIQKCSVGPKWNNYLLKYNSIYVQGPSSIFHRSLFNSVGGFDLSLHYTMDTDLWYRFYNRGQKFIRINSYFWGFRIHEGSKTSHAFSSAPNEKFSAERRGVLIKNDRKLKPFFKYLLIFYKLINGTFLKSLYSTLKYRNEDINTLNEFSGIVN